jgi:hypothetical protein
VQSIVKRDTTGAIHMRGIFRLGFIMLTAVASFAGPAAAQATRTWVSGVGDDANPCSRTAPCKTFAGAISKTATNGEINIIDPGGFGAVTITKPISIVAEGATGGILSSGVNGIVININPVTFPTPPRRVYLDGLDIDGVGTGLNGIRILSADSVVVRNSSIRNHRAAGAGFGIDVQSSLAVDVVLDQVAITGNLGGVNVSTAGPTNRVFIQDSTITHNTSFSVKASGTGARVSLNRSTLRNSALDLDISNSALVSSFQNNVIGSGAPNDVNPLE